MRLFHTMLDNSILNAYVILLSNESTYSSNRKDKIVYFMKSVTKTFISPHAQQRLQAPKTSKIVRPGIGTCNITFEMHKMQPADTLTIAKSRCKLCPRQGYYFVFISKICARRRRRLEWHPLQVRRKQDYG